MNTIYAVEKATNLLTFTSDSIATIKYAIEKLGKKDSDFYILEEFNMRYISRIVYVDGECVYNNKDFWTSDLTDIVDNYDQHDVLDFMGKPVDYLRFKIENDNNRNRLFSIDGTAGQVEYNITVGSEIISLLREECISVDHGDVTPNSMFVKAFQNGIITALQVGCFREVIPYLDALERDEFFTEERINKYKAMITAADVISYE